MRLFGGLSTGIGRARVGISRRGNLWTGIRGGSGPAYVGVLASTHKHRQVHADPETQITFVVEDDGTIKLGGGIVNREQLEKVLAASHQAERTK